MNNNDDIKLTQLYNELDLYLGASVTGEKVEIIITPKEEDGKYNKDKRVVTIGLQNGFSRERVHFAIEDGKKFDDVVLPEILEYLNVDKNSDWDISTPTTEDGTVKTIIETELGAAVYLETFDNDLIEKLKNTTIMKKVNSQIEPMQQEQLEWQTIINYVRERIVAEDFIQKILTDSERNKLEEFVYSLCENRAFSFKTKAKKATIMRNLHLVFENETYTEELKNNGIDEDTYTSIHTNFDKETLEKMKNRQIIEQIATTIQATKKVNDFIKNNHDKLTTSIEEFNRKIEFTIGELLGKTKYFQKRNASYKFIMEHEQDKNYGNNCFGAVEELKQEYLENSNSALSEEQKNMYIAYCNQIQEFLKTKANQSKKDSNSISFSQLENINYIDNLEELESKIELFKNARVNDEKFEVIITKHPDDKAKRLVRIAITNGMSRNDEYNFLFTDGNKFDKDNFNIIFDKLIESDKIKESVMGSENLSRTLFTTEEGNELLIDNDIYSVNRSHHEQEQSKTLENNVDSNNVQNTEMPVKESINKGSLSLEIDNTNKDVVKEQVTEKEQSQSMSLPKEDEELAEYFRKKILRDNKQLPPVGLNRIKELAENNERVAALEEARERLNNGTLSQEEYDRIQNTYKEQLTETVKDISEKRKNNEKLNSEEEHSKPKEKIENNDNFSNRLDAIEKALYNYIIEKEQHRNEIEGKEEKEDSKEAHTKYSDNKEKNNDSIVGEKEKGNNSLEEIKDAYEVADQYSSIENPASFRIYFPKETSGFGKVIISLGTSGEEVLLEKVIPKDELMNGIDELCQCFVSNSGVTEEIHQQVPNTPLGLLIVTGRNDNVFQVSNTENKDIEIIKESIKVASEITKGNSVGFEGRNR